MPTSSISASDKKRQDEYRAKDDARTLSDAEEIHADPNRLDGAHKHLKHSQDALHRTLSRIHKRSSSKSSKRSSSRR